MTSQDDERLARINAEREAPYQVPCRFSFDDEVVFDGFTNGTHWNGFLNVEVTSEVRDAIVAHLRGSGPVGEDGDGSDYTGGIETLPIRDGRVSLANGFATVEVLEEPESYTVSEIAGALAEIADPDAIADAIAKIRARKGRS